jgi:hypothetical protein
MTGRDAFKQIALGTALRQGRLKPRRACRWRSRGCVGSVVTVLLLLVAVVIGGRRMIREIDLLEARYAP